MAVAGRWASFAAPGRAPVALGEPEPYGVYIVDGDRVADAVRGQPVVDGDHERVGAGGEFRRDPVCFEHVKVAAHESAAVKPHQRAPRLAARLIYADSDVSVRPGDRAVVDRDVRRARSRSAGVGEELGELRHEFRIVLRVLPGDTLEKVHLRGEEGI